MGELRIQLLPVGRGDCLLLRFPDHSWAVIDCGQKRGAYEPYNQAASFLNNEVPTNSPVRFVLATHPHADHDGGILQLLELLGQTRSIHAVYYSGIERRAAKASSSWTPDDGVFSFVDEANARVARGEIHECRPLKIGEPIMLDPDIEDFQINVLWPDTQIVQTAAGLEVTQMGGKLVNNLSVVLRLEFNGASALFLGDVQGSVCVSVATRGFDGVFPCIIKAPHHGAKESILPWDSFGDVNLRARYVLISSPTDEDEHPDVEFLRSIPNQNWRIRCTGLARVCTQRQPAEVWPVPRSSSFVPESLRRSLFSPLGKQRFPQLGTIKECCLDNRVTLYEDGTIDHSRVSRSCDGFRDFR